VLQTDAPKQQYGSKNPVRVLLYYCITVLLLSAHMPMSDTLARSNYQYFPFDTLQLMQQLGNFYVHCEDKITEELL
jgi:hypothetical protein